MAAPAVWNRRSCVAAGTVITASGQTGPLAMESNADTPLSVYASITAASGTTPSITFGIEFDSDPGGATWPVGGYAAATTGTAQTASGADVLVASASPPRTGSGDTRYYRITWTVSGTTPSFTLGALYADN